MKRILASLLVVLGVMAAPAAFAQNTSGDTAPGQTSTTGQSTQSSYPGTIPETRFKSNVRFPNQAIFGGNMTVQDPGAWSNLANPVAVWSNIPSIVLRPYGKKPTDNLDTYIIWTTPSSTGTPAARTYTIPDAGGNANFLMSAGNQSASGTFTVPKLILTGTSFNDTIQALAGQGQASTLTIDDVGAASGFIYTFAAAQAAPGVLSRADAVVETGDTLFRNMLSVRNLDGSSLAAAASAGKFGISTTATFGSPSSLALVTEAANSNTKTDAGEFEYTLPPDYVAGSAINVVVNGNYILGGGTIGTKSLTVDAFLMAAAGTAGSNLGPAAQNLTGSNAAYTFAITPTGLVAGNKLLIQVQTVIQDTGGSNITAVLNDIAVKANVQM